VCVRVFEQKLYVIYSCNQINYFLIILLIAGEGAIYVWCMLCFTLHCTWWIYANQYLR